MGSDSFFNRSDFESAIVTISIKNLTSNSGHLQKKGTPKIELLELYEDGLSLSIPSGICAKGHKLELNLDIKNLSKMPFQIDQSGTVSMMEKTSEEMATIRVVLSDPQNVAWRDLARLYQSRQKSINEFLQGSRGY